MGPCWKSAGGARVTGGVTREHHQVLPSTQTRALELARSWHAAPGSTTIVTADRQDQGYGRTGPWIDPGGDALFVSILSVGPHPPSILTNLSERCGQAVVGELQKLDPEVEYEAPNDIVQSGTKVGGLLVDASTVGDSVVWVVVGVGVNIGAAPEGFRALTVDRAKTEALIVQAVTAVIAAR